MGGGEGDGESSWFDPHICQMALPVFFKNRMRSSFPSGTVSVVRLVTQSLSLKLMKWGMWLHCLFTMLFIAPPKPCCGALSCSLWCAGHCLKLLDNYLPQPTLNHMHAATALLASEEGVAWRLLPSLPQHQSSVVKHWTGTWGEHVILGFRLIRAMSLVDQMDKI